VHAAHPAGRHGDALETAVRDELGQRLYDAIHAQAAVQEPAGIDEQVLFDALKDNLSPQAVAAIVAYLQPANTSNPEVNRQLRWLADRLTDIVGGPEQLDRLTDGLGL
jgi:cytochrome c1